MTGTPLDRAHAGMEAAPDDDLARLRFYDRLSNAELFLLLDDEPEGAHLSPRVFPLAEGRFVVAFDTEERLGAFVGAPAPYAGLTGRALAAMLAGQGLGLGLNLSVSSSAALLPGAAIDWLADVLAHEPTEATERPRSVHAPGVPEAFVKSLDVKLAAAAGLARSALLASISYADGRRCELLAFVDPRPGAEGALSRAAGEALTFSGLATGAMDVAFLKSADAMTSRLERVALRFDLPVPEKTKAPAPPDSDPERPPRLR